MKIEELESCPEWLKAARTLDADVELLHGAVLWRGDVELLHGAVLWHRGEWLGGEWHGGEWHGGEWHGGEWHGGTWLGGSWLGGTWLGGSWLGGEWHGGEWLGGEWHGGEWHGGTWHGGEWYGGEWNDGDWAGGSWRGGSWHGGTWHGGEWCGGEWHGQENRLLYMASLIGIVFDGDGRATAYRTTQVSGRGRHNPDFEQPAGHYEEHDLPPAGSGTCVRGIHVAAAAKAWTYFGVDATCRFWRVEFKREALLDCDGEKARISGGVFTEIARPF